jgi:hypothetical protein
LLKKFVSLGKECVKFLKAARSSHGKIFAILCLLFAYLCTSVTLLLSFLSPSCAKDDLAAANACISSLEAELKASRKAWDAATAAKPLLRSPLSQHWLGQRKQRKPLLMLTRSVSSGSRPQLNALIKCRLLLEVNNMLCPSLLTCEILILADMCLFSVFISLFVLEHTGVSLASLQLDDNPLMAAVNLLESHWISIQEIFELANRVLTWIFIGLWPKQKADVPADDLKKLAKVFDTPEDPILLMKSCSVKRGADTSQTYL